MDLDTRIASLPSFSAAKLRLEWERVHGHPPPQGLGASLLARGIAYRLQEQAYGGLSPTLQRELARLAQQLERFGELDVERQLKLKTGTRLVSILIKAGALRALGSEPSNAAVGNDDVVLTVAAKLARTGREVRLVVAPSAKESATRRDPALIKLLVKAVAARSAVEAARSATLAQVAAAQGHAPEYFAVLLRLGYLAPDIIGAVLAGLHPTGLTRQKLARVSALPLGWQVQREMLGFSGA